MEIVAFSQEAESGRERLFVARCSLEVISPRHAFKERSHTTVAILQPGIPFLVLMVNFVAFKVGCWAFVPSKVYFNVSLAFPFPAIAEAEFSLPFNIKFRKEEGR